MPSNVTMNDGTGSIKAVTKQVTHDGDTASLQGVSLIVATGTEDSYTITDVVGGSGVVTAGTIRTVLATDVALPAGTNAIGKLAANSGVDIGDVDVTSIVPGTGATNLGKAIDTATGATDTGVLVLATRDDALSSLTPVEGDNVQLRVDSTGALWCAITGTVTVGSHAVTNAGTFAVQAAQSGTWNITNISGTISLPTGAATLAEQQTQTTALQLIDDAFYVDDADWTALTSKHALVGGVYNVTPRTITDGDTAPVALDVNGHVIVNQHSENATLSDGSSNQPNLAVDDADEVVYDAAYGFAYNGTTWDRVRGDATNGLLVNLGGNNDVTVTGTVSGTGTAGSAASGVLTIQGIASMTAIQVADNSGSLTVDAPVGTPVFVRLSDGAAAITTLPVSLASVPSHAVTNAGTFAVQESGTQVQVDDAAFTPATSKIVMVGFEADETSTDSVDEGDGGAARMTLDRKVIVTPQPHTAGGCAIFRSLDLDETEEDVKTSAGQVYGLMFTNTATTTRWLKFYNATAANVTVGTTTPVITIGLPGNTSDDISGVFANGGMGIAFDTAICVAATTGVADNDTGAPSANDVIVNIFYK